MKAKPPARSILAGLLLSAAAAPAQEPCGEAIRAFDRVTYKNLGGVEQVVEGTILSETADELVINDRGIHMTIKAKDVTQKQPRCPAAEVYKFKLKKLQKADEPSARAALHLAIGLWCLLPEVELDGAAPMADRAFDHLHKAVQNDPKLHKAYPHLLDGLAQRRDASGGGLREDEIENELDIYMLAAAGGFEDIEIDFRMAEIFHLYLGRTSQAAAMFEKALQASAKAACRNHAMERRARKHLAAIFQARGETQKAVAILQASAAGSGSDYESHLLRADYLLGSADPAERKKAREPLDAARKLEPDLPAPQRSLSALDLADGKLSAAAIRLDRLVQGGLTDIGLRVDLAVLRVLEGKFKKAQALIDGVLASNGGADEGSKADIARAHAASALIQDLRGQTAAAIPLYEQALAADPGFPAASLLLAGAQLRAGDAAGARAGLAAFSGRHSSRPALFSAFARAMADVELASGQKRKALNFLEYATEIEPKDPLLRKKCGILLLGLGEVDRAYGHLEAARKNTEGQDPALLNALGCYEYQRGRFEEARKLFARVIGIVPRPQGSEGKPAPPPSPDRLYAERGLQLTGDAMNLEIWLDDFSRAASEDIARNWRESESYGISIAIKDDKLVFSGQQANEASGVTTLTRDEAAENVEHVSARLRFGPSSGAVRAGIRLEVAEGRGGGPSAGLVFFRDADGRLKFARKTTRTGWEDGQPSPDTDVAKGKLVYKGDLPWPEDGAFHTMMIRRMATRSGTAASNFELLLDGRPIAQNVGVDGLRAKIYSVGVSGQTDTLGASYVFEADDFRIYRQRASETQAKQR